MKKIKVTFMILAILAGIGGAFATKLHDPDTCLNAQQYHKVGSSYVPAGQIGVNYDCITPLSNTCTYWINPATNQYEACRIGTYLFIQ